MRNFKNKFDEAENLLALIASLDLKADRLILDIGCGHGKYLKLLQENGLNGVGVDINASIVKTNLANGLSCMTPEEFDRSSDSYDLMIMSHVIEHFPPPELLHFIEHYLERLNTGGHLIIATPLMWPCFYADFDHIRPYPPEAIDWMFCLDNPQVQFCSKYRLERTGVRIRRQAILPSWGQKLYLEQNRPRLYKLQEKLFGFLFNITAGLIGMTTGWIGLYKYKGPRNESEQIAP